MEASIWISQIKFKNGTLVNLKEDSIVLLVGPNNVGKSRALDELFDTVAPTRNLTKYIIEGVELSQKGSGDQFLTSIKHREKNGQYYYNLQDNSSIDGNSLINAWSNLNTTNYNNRFVTRFLIKKLSTEDRLGLVAPAQMINFLEDIPRHPIQKLKINDTKEFEFSRYFKLAFGEDAIINHGAGNNIPIHIGDRPQVTMDNDRVSTLYLKELSKLGTLHSQGDGMKSFAGVVLGLFDENYSMNIIDEPEAFLHPPQATLLGRMIAKDIGINKQIFIATHSEHLLKGVLDNSRERLVIIRIQRDGNLNKLNILNNEEIGVIWKDSLLRHSNVLDGLFHKKVILCESDSDNRFFSAVSTSITEQQGLPAKDILFVQSGGKHRFPVVIKALKKLEVPLTVVGDFDLYNDEQPIKKMFEDLGGDWDDIETDFKIVKLAIDQKRPELETAQLKKSIDDLFATITENVIPGEKIKQIEKELRRSSPWTQAKSSGKAYLPPGNATNSFNSVQTKLQEKGIFILEVGEIEAFDKTVGGHGPKWVNEVLVKDLILAPELSEARDFVKNVILT